MLLGLRVPTGTKTWLTPRKPPLSEEQLKVRIVALLWEGSRRMQMDTETVVAELQRKNKQHPAAYWSKKQGFIEATVAELRKMHEEDLAQERHSRVCAAYRKYHMPVGLSAPSHETPFGAGMGMLQQVLPGPVKPALRDDDDDVPVPGEFTIYFTLDDVVSLGAKILRPASKSIMRSLLRADFGEELLTRDVDAL